jgi:NADH-quinone oxidoreductase subunit G
MEAAVRTAYQWATGTALPADFKLEAARGLGGIKEAELRLPLPSGERKLRIAIASGVGHARALLQQMMSGASPMYDFVEVMACPGGACADLVSGWRMRG